MRLKRKIERGVLLVGRRGWEGRERRVAIEVSKTKELPTFKTRGCMSRGGEEVECACVWGELRKENKFAKEREKKEGKGENKSTTSRGVGGK